jgi:hypothetical protein
MQLGSFWKVLFNKALNGSGPSGSRFSKDVDIVPMLLHVEAEFSTLDAPRLTDDSSFWLNIS